jgi:hypothetical protein
MINRQQSSMQPFVKKKAALRARSSTALIRSVALVQ